MKIISKGKVLKEQLFLNPLMKLPKTFIPKKVKELNPEDIKIFTPGLEDLILGSVNGKVCEERIISILVSNHLYNAHYSHLGITPYQVSKVAITKYDNDHHNILLIEYTDEKDLINNLEKIYANGSEFLDRWYPVKFMERFLHKNNIAVYINGEQDFIKTAAEHYKKLGFKQIA